MQKNYKDCLHNN